MEDRVGIKKHEYVNITQNQHQQ